MLISRRFSSIFLPKGTLRVQIAPMTSHAKTRQTIVEYSGLRDEMKKEIIGM